MQTINCAPREIDRLIAEQVMGWTNLSVAGTRFGTTPEGKSHSIVPQYSTDLSAAWEVVEKLRQVGYQGGINWSDSEPEYECAFGSSNVPPHERQSCRAETASLAICLAALQIVGIPISFNTMDRNE